MALSMSRLSPLCIMLVALVCSISALSIDTATECHLRSFASQYSGYIQPQNARANWTALTADALQLSILCANVSGAVTNFTKPKTKPTRSFVPVGCLFVAVNGSDTAAGTISAPLQTVQRALRIIRSRRSSGQAPCIYVRGGKYYFGTDMTSQGLAGSSRVGAISLVGVDSGVSILAYSNEEVIFSGGMRIYPNFTVHSTSHNGKTILSAPLPTAAVVDWTHLNEVFVDGRRAIRARFPNGNAETMGRHTVPSGLLPSAPSWISAAEYPHGHAVTVQTSAPNRTGVYFIQFTTGVGGPADIFDPPVSFWANDGNKRMDGAVSVWPAGLVWNETLMSPRTAQWETEKSAFVHAYQNLYWGNWMFAMDAVDSKAQTIRFGAGGFQEAHGGVYGGRRTSGADWYVDHVFAELDDGDEFYIDFDTRTIFFIVNQTMPQEFVISQLPCILSVHGSQTLPVSDVLIDGITFTETSNTFMSPYESPDSGDWSLHSGGAVYITGGVNVTIRNGKFIETGGNAVTIVDYNNDVAITNNEFVWIGDSAIIILGHTRGINGISYPTQPNHTIISFNLFHELGIYTKQSSAVFHAKSRRTYIHNNICFNVPRACININDGFYGGLLMNYNILFNAVRETADHGPFNSWDRQPYLVQNDEEINNINNINNNNNNIPSLTPITNELSHNLILDFYSSVWPIDHDDGSAFYTDTYNVLIFGGWKSYLGNNKKSEYNLYIYPQTTQNDWGAYCASHQADIGIDGFSEIYSNNHCITTNNVVYSLDCNSFQNLTAQVNIIIPVLQNNTFYLNMSNNALVYCSTPDQSITLNEFDISGGGYGSQVKPLPTSPQLIDMAIQVLIS